MVERGLAELAISSYDPKCYNIPERKNQRVILSELDRLAIARPLGRIEETIEDGSDAICGYDQESLNFSRALRIKSRLLSELRGTRPLSFGRIAVRCKKCGTIFTIEKTWACPKPRYWRVILAKCPTCDKVRDVEYVDLERRGVPLRILATLAGILLILIALPSGYSGFLDPANASYLAAGLAMLFAGAVKES